MSIAQCSKIASVDGDCVSMPCSLVLSKWNLTIPSLRNELAALNGISGLLNEVLVGKKESRPSGDIWGRPIK